MSYRYWEAPRVLAPPQIPRKKKMTTAQLAYHIGLMHPQITIGTVAKLEQKYAGKPTLFIKELQKLHRKAHGKSPLW